MPRYDYRCPSCNKVFEVSHGMLEHPVVKCPDCGTEALKVFDASGIVLKGSGFYNTDERGKSGATQGTMGDSSHELAKTGNGHKDIKKHAEGPSTLAKNSDKPASTAKAPTKQTA